VLRGLKYGIFAAILAGLIAMPAWGAVDKSITLVVDGQPQTIRTSAADVGQLLASRGYRVDGHDVVAPATGAALHDGMRVVLRRGRLLRLSVDGARRDVWTTAQTVAAALAQLGYPASDFVSVSRSQRLPMAPSSLTIRTPRRVTVVVHGQRREVSTTDGTVGEVLADLGVSVGTDDQVRPRPDTAVRDGAVIRVQQLVRKTVSRRETIGFPTRRRIHPKVLKGHTRVVQPGRRGVVKVRYAIVYLDGKRVGRTRIGSSVLRAPRPRVLAVGTKQPPADQLTIRHRRAVVRGARYGLGLGPAAARAISRPMAKAHGWSGAQYHCLLVLWFHESSWRVDATNPGSGAYGIPQALPAYRLASAGPDWRTNPVTQIRWGLNYIASRYGTPCNAWYEWQAHGGWY
jgi:uncharacterized protein YabE (DUF348 family)